MHVTYDVLCTYNVNKHILSQYGSTNKIPMYNIFYHIYVQRQNGYRKIQ